MQRLLFMVVVGFSANLFAGEFLEAGLYVQTDIAIGFGNTLKAATADAESAVPKGFKADSEANSPAFQCTSKRQWNADEECGQSRVRYVLPLVKFGSPESSREQEVAVGSRLGVSEDKERIVRTDELSGGGSEVLTMYKDLSTEVSWEIETISETGKITSSMKSFRNGDELIENFSSRNESLVSRQRTHNHGSILENFSEDGKLVSRQVTGPNGQSKSEVFQ